LRNVYSVASAMTAAATRAMVSHSKRDSSHFSRRCRVSRALFFSHSCLHTLPCKHLAVSLRATIGMRLEGRHSRSAYAANDKYLRLTRVSH
jgi:hypothetical protein